MFFTYDGLDRLTSETTPQGSVSYTYDAAGRRTKLTAPNQADTIYTWDNANRLTGISQGTQSVTFGLDAANRLTKWGANTLTYDLNGSLLSALGQSFTWDARNQLATSTGTPAGSYVYDAVGRRQSKTLAGTQTRFLYDGSQPIQELTSSNTLTASLLTGSIDELFSRTASGATQSFLTDALNSTIRLTDSAGAKVVDYTYEAYGKASNDNAASTNRFQYTGRENDTTGLQYNRARYYHPQLDRFISEDPIGLAGGYNRYSYVGGNPVSYTDPRGLDPWWKDPSVNYPIGGGCGSGWSEWLVPDIYPDACKKHDECYSRKGSCRSQCDNELFKNAFTESGPSPNVLVPGIFWGAVRIFGSPAYNDAQNR